LAGIPEVQAAYLLDAQLPQVPDRLVRLIAISVPRANSERAARAVIVAIQKECERRQCSVDLTTFDPGSDPPVWIEGLRADPFYRGPQK
jgi:hypothetical protein